MAEYDNTNRGIMSRNERRESDKHPEFTGHINVEGVIYWISSWVQERKDGSGKFFSISIKKKDQQSKPQASNKPLREELNDDIPF